MMMIIEESQQRPSNSNLIFLSGKFGVFWKVFLQDPSEHWRESKVGGSMLSLSIMKMMPTGDE